MTEPARTEAPPPPATFRTKTGVCHVTREELTLEREGRMSRLLFGQARPPAATYLLISVAAAGAGVLGWQAGSPGLIGVGTAAPLLLLFAAISVGYSGTNRIARAEAESVVAHPPNPPRTRGYVDVRFRRGGTLRRRLIMLPGSRSGGAEEWPRALEALRHAGWLSGGTGADGGAD